MVTRKFLSLLLLVAIPATAQTFGLSIGSSRPCLVLGNTTWRIAAPGTRADTTVRIDSAAPSPDIRIQLSDAPDAADLVVVDDGEHQAGCHAAATVRNVTIDAEATTPDLTIGLVAPSAPTDYRIFVRSDRIEPMAAAALFAASKSAAQRRTAHQSN